MPRNELAIRAAILSVSLSLIASDFARAETSEELLARGAKLHLNGDDLNAVECFTKAIQLDPQDSRAYEARGEAQNNPYLGWGERARRDFEKAVDLDPKNYQATAYRGFCYRTSNEQASSRLLLKAIELAKSKPPSEKTACCIAYASYWLNPKSALEDVKSAAEKYPNNIDCQFLLASVYDHQGKRSEAFTHFNETLKLAKKASETDRRSIIFRMIARSYVGLGERQAGIDWFTHYVERHPKSVYANYWRGYLLVLDKQFNLAIPQLRKAIELGPKHQSHLAFTAQQLMALKKYREAAIYLRRAIDLDGTESILVCQRAACLKEIGLTPLAITELRKQVEAQPDLYKALEQLSDLERSTNEPQARQDLNKAIEIVSWRLTHNPESTNLLQDRANLLEKANLPNKALADIQRALQINPSDPALWHKSAAIKWGKFRRGLEAIADQTRAVETCAASNKAGYLLTRGSYYLALDQLENCLKDANSCIAFEPRSGHGYRLRAEVFMKQKRFPEAIADLTEATKHRSTVADDVDYLLARCFAQTGKRKNAIAALNASLAHNPRHIASLVERGRLYLESDEIEPALVDLNAVLKLDPENGDATYFRARANAASGRYSEAIQDISAAMELKKEVNGAWLLEDRAKFYTYAERYKEAAADLDRAYRFDRSTPRRILNCGKLLYHAGEKQKAIRAISEYLESVPNDIRALRARARCFLETKQFERSLADYTSLLAADPTNPVFYALRAKVYAAQGDFKNRDADFAKAKELTTARSEPG